LVLASLLRQNCPQAEGRRAPIRSNISHEIKRVAVHLEARSVWTATGLRALSLDKEMLAQNDVDMNNRYRGADILVRSDPELRPDVKPARSSSILLCTFSDVPQD
jgi:hypothetical protein